MTEVKWKPENEKPAILGGQKAVQSHPGDMLDWPIVTPEDEAGILDVLRRRAMSGTDITREFEKEFMKWQGCDYALGSNNGTSSIHAAMFGCGLGVGDEIICPGATYWAAAAPAFSLGATVVFADLDPVTLCIDPKDIEPKIGPRTKAIIVVHNLAHPADMDGIMAVAARHALKVIEDVSHAQGGLYKGRRLGSIGDVGAMSLMSGKSLAAGEGGMLVTDNREIYERAIAFGHYERYDDTIRTESLKPYSKLPMGGYKYRMHQMSAAVGRVQLRHYDERCDEITRAMNYFWDLVETVPGIRGHRVAGDSGSTMAGWYIPHGILEPEKLGGLSLTRFTEAVKAEGDPHCFPGCNKLLFNHGLFRECDVYGHGKPTRIANAQRDVRGMDDPMPVCREMMTRVFFVPWFKHYRPEIIREYAGAYIKVALNYKNLLPGDKGNPDDMGAYHFFRH